MSNILLAFNMPFYAKDLGPDIDKSLSKGIKMGVNIKNIHEQH